MVNLCICAVRSGPNGVWGVACLAGLHLLGDGIALCGWLAGRWVGFEFAACLYLACCRCRLWVPTPLCSGAQSYPLRGG